jgi:hypothetical protein
MRDEQAAAAGVSEWLATAHPEPERPAREWGHYGMALLPLGTSFAAVRLGGDLVQAALGPAHPDHRARVLAELLDGPIIYDPWRGRQGTYYALVPWPEQDEWRHGVHAERLGPDVYLGVPRLDRTEPPGPHWAAAPRYSGDLCCPQSLSALVTRAVEARAEGSDTVFSGKGQRLGR